jgi:hypothetical protein
LLSVFGFENEYVVALVSKMPGIDRQNLYENLYIWKGLESLESVLFISRPLRPQFFSAYLSRRT